MFRNMFIRWFVFTLSVFVFFLAFTMEHDIPDYDMDSEDERWVNAQAKTMDITPNKVEWLTEKYIVNVKNKCVYLKSCIFSGMYSSGQNCWKFLEKMYFRGLMVHKTTFIHSNTIKLSIIGKIN